MQAISTVTTLLFLSITALIAAEFVPVSLLTTIAEEIGISYGLAGQTVTAVGIMAMLSSLILAPLFKKLDRKYLLLALILNLALSSFIIAFAQGALSLFVGRALLGISVGGFWSQLNSVMQNLFKDDPKKLPKAFSFVLSGVSVATIIALPGAKFLGDFLGFRGVFLLLGAFALILAFSAYKVLPKIAPSDNVSFKTLSKLLLDFKVIICLVMLCGGYFSYHIIFTYVRVILDSAALSSQSLTLTLLVLAVFNVLGTIVSGKILSTHFNLTFILVPLFMLAAIFALYLSLGRSIEILPLTVLTFGFGFLPVLWQLWLLKIMPHLTEMVSCLQVAIIQLSVGLAASVGGVMVDDFGLESLLTISAIVGLVVLSLVPLALPSRLLRAQTALS